MKHLCYSLTILVIALCVNCLGQKNIEQELPKDIYGFTVKEECPLYTFMCWKSKETV